MLNIKIADYIDLTSLNGDDTEKRICELCEKALKFNVAGVCVYPAFVKLVKKKLNNTPIKAISVAGGFPSGQTFTQVKLLETKFAIDEGADEIDFVINRGKIIEKEYNYVLDEIAKAKEICKDSCLKVIIETGELITAENISNAGFIAIDAGCDFIKTSTGKIQIGATIESATCMLNIIKNHYELTGRKVGFKAAGGISSPEDAFKYYELVKNILGSNWLNNKYFRIGGSKIIDRI